MVLKELLKVYLCGDSIGIIEKYLRTPQVHKVKLVCCQCHKDAIIEAGLYKCITCVNPFNIFRYPITDIRC